MIIKTKFSLVESSRCSRLVSISPIPSLFTLVCFFALFLAIEIEPGSIDILPALKDEVLRRDG